MKNITLKLKHHRADFLLMQHEANDNNRCSFDTNRKIGN